MTQPPTATVPPASAPDRASVPVPPRPDPPVPAEAPAGPPRRTALAEGLSQLRAAAHIEPGKLRIIGAVLAGLLLLFGAVAFWEVSARTGAADTARYTSQPLSSRAAKIYRSLADANTTAAAGFLAGTEEAPEVRQRYEDNIAAAARLLADAAAHSAGSAEAQRHIAVLNEELPYYTGLVETARSNNRQGLPLGGAYLRFADQRMQGTLLSAAEALYELETRRFQQDLDDARTPPWLGVGSGLLALAVLVWAQRRHWLRTHRVFNRGLLAATAAATVLLAWLAGAHAMSRAALNTADEDAAQSLSVLNRAWTEALKSRGDENMSLVARGAGSASEESYQAHMGELAGTEGATGAEPVTGEGLLGRAERLADDAAGRDPLRRAVAATGEWRVRHAEARRLELAGLYQQAVVKVIGAEGSSGQSFDEVDASLNEAVLHEQREFVAAADDGLGALGGLRAGAVMLTVLGTGAAVFGIGGRLSEYR